MIAVIKWGRGVSTTFPYGVKVEDPDGIRLDNLVGANTYHHARIHARNVAQVYRQLGYTVRIFPYR